MQATCNKCKVSRPISGDTWCVGCSAWEVVGQELCGGWQGPGGLKEIANDLVLGTARSIRALRSLGAGLRRAPSVPLPAVPEPVVPPRGSGARGEAGAGEAPAAASKTGASAPESEYTYTDGEETPEETREEKKQDLVDTRPSLPRRVGGAGAPERGRAGLEDKSPVVKKEISEESRSEGRRDRERKRAREGSERRKGKSEKKKDRKERREKDSGKKKRKRGGRKHQRVHRLAEQPYLQVHRRLASSFLDARPSL